MLLWSLCVCSPAPLQRAGQGSPQEPSCSQHPAPIRSPCKSAQPRGSAEPPARLGCPSGPVSSHPLSLALCPCAPSVPSLHLTRLMPSLVHRIEPGRAGFGADLGFQCLCCPALTESVHLTEQHLSESLDMPAVVV